MTRLQVNGIRLDVETLGTGPPLMLLHGFTGSSSTWLPFAKAWRGFTTVAVDLIGHGASDSPAGPPRYRMDACVDDLAAVLDTLGIQRTALLGYSLGGRVALHFGLKYPERLSALVLESASPGIADAGERQERVRSDERLAQLVERDGVEAFVDHWEQIPLWASQARLPPAERDALRRQRLHNSTTGIANSLRGMGAGAQEPLFDRLCDVRAPALLVVGALDERYVELAHTMVLTMPRAELRIIEDAGHAAHFEQPTAFGAIVSEFLARSRTIDALEV